MRLTDKQQQALVRTAHLLPSLTALILLIFAALPHFFYQSGVGTSSTMGVFQILNISFDESLTYFGTTMIESTVADFYFYVWLIVFCVLSWACVFFYAVYAVIHTVVSIFVVWSPDLHPTQGSNLIKRIYRVIVPNRGFYAFYNLLPLLPSFFPLILQTLYRRILMEKVTTYYFGIPVPVDSIVAILLCGASIALFFVSLKAQKRCRMDLFRIYKAEN